MDYSRQSMISELHVPKCATVIGAGGLGTWVSYFAALSGVERLILFAPGTVAESDLGRFPYHPGAVGLPRGEAVRFEIRRVRPNCNVKLHGRFWEEGSAEHLEGIVFNCAAGPSEFDQRLISFTEKKGIRYVSGAYSGNELLVFDENGPKLAPTVKPVGAWSSSLSICASMMLYSAFVAPISFQGTPKELADNSPIDVRASARSDMAR